MVYHLKFESQQQAESVLYEPMGPMTIEVTGETPENIQIPRVKKYQSVIMIGKLYEGNIVNPAKELNGYHANVYSQNSAPELEPFQVFPKTPHYTWMI